jgi:hypothetical protein
MGKHSHARTNTVHSTRGMWHNGEGQMKGMNSVQRGGGHIVGGAEDD